MSNVSELKINALPSKTWYWLNLNDTRVAWDSNTVPCNIETDGCAAAFYDAQSNDYADISAAVKQALQMPLMFYLQMKISHL